MMSTQLPTVAPAIVSEHEYSWAVCRPPSRHKARLPDVAEHTFNDKES